MRRLAAHRAEFQAAPVYQVNAMVMVIVGKPKGFVKICEADRDTTDGAKLCEEIRCNVKDHAKRGKFYNKAVPSI